LFSDLIHDESIFLDSLKMPLPTSKNLFKLKQTSKFNDCSFSDFIYKDVKSYQRSFDGSEGERLCEKWLKQAYPTIQIIYEVTLKTLPNRRYDLVFGIPGKTGIYFLEFDGAQHFQKTHDFWKGKSKEFQDYRKADAFKTEHVLNKGFMIIRIDWNDDHLIKDHLDFAIAKLGQKYRYYRTNPRSYLHISKHLNKCC